MDSNISLQNTAQELKSKKRIFTLIFGAHNHVDLKQVILYRVLYIANSYLDQRNLIQRNLDPKEPWSKGTLAIGTFGTKEPWLKEPWSRGTLTKPWPKEPRSKETLAKKITK